jgi:hypothetical protein
LAVWQSYLAKPNLIKPDSLQFIDINHDRYLDIAVGNITNTGSEDENCYAAGDMVFLLSFPSLTPIGSARQIGVSVSVLGIYNSDQLYPEPQKLYGNLNQIIHGSNGAQLSAFAN